MKFMLVSGIVLAAASPFAGWQITRLINDKDIAVLTFLMMLIGGITLLIISLLSRMDGEREQ